MPEALAEALAAGVTIFRVSTHVEAAGAPVQVRLTLEAKSLTEVTVIVKVAEPPAVTVPCVGLSASEKSGEPGAEPLPVSVTD